MPVFSGGFTNMDVISPPENKLANRTSVLGWIFIILKDSHQDLSNEESNFILSSLEVGH